MREKESGDWDTAFRSIPSSLDSVTLCSEALGTTSRSSLRLSWSFV
jgi:hypothetical protein